MLELRVLGALDLRRDGERLEPALRKSKASALLAHLAVEATEEPVRRDTLVALLWPDRPAEKGRNALRVTLSRLRRDIGEGVIGGKGEESLWIVGGEMWSDISVFRRSREQDLHEKAYRTYGGPFLDGFHLSGAAPYERWVDGVRRRFQHQAYRSALLAGDERLEKGDAQGAETAFRRAMEIDPHREGALRRLLTLLARRGDGPAARREYLRFRDRLQEDLDLSPSAETEAILAEAQGTPLAIAVLPFRDLSPDAEDAHLAEGIAEDILEGLTQYGAIDVAARSSSFPLAGEDARTVAEDLQVDYVLEGSLRRSEDRLRVSARLVEAPEGRNAWSRSFEARIGDIFSLQDEITAGLLGSLEVEILEGDDGQPAAVDPEAYELFLRGRQYWNRRYEVGLGTALEYFEEALAMDEGFARAHAAVGQIHAVLGGYGIAPPDRSRRQAWSSARRAVELDPELSDSFLARGMARFIDYSLREAERDFLRAAELDPQYARAHLWRGLMATVRTGRWTETARRSAARARRAAPRSPYIIGGVGLMNLFTGRSEEAESLFEQVLQDHREYVLALYGRALARSELGRHADALPDLEKAESLTHGADFIRAFLGAVAGRAARVDRAFTILDDLESRSSERHVDPLLFAFVEANIHRMEDARRHLEEALLVRSPGLSALGRLPLLAPLRGEDSSLPPALRSAGLAD